MPELTNPHGTATRADLLRAFVFLVTIIRYDLPASEVNEIADELVASLNKDSVSDIRPRGSLNDVQGIIDVSEPTRS
jgi:hypothetical protein